MTLELAKSLLGLLAPEVVINNFKLVSLEEKTGVITLRFEEFPELVPSILTGGAFKENGFMNKIELHTFPQKGKSCYLQIFRRRWLDKESGKSYCNNYDLHKKGIKATEELGAFLKKNNRSRAYTI